MMKTNQELESLKKAAFDSIEKATRRTLTYAKQLDVGEERTRWVEISETIKFSTFINNR